MVYTVVMYLRKLNRQLKNNSRDYWQLVETYRTTRGPRQRVIANLSLFDETERVGIAETVNGKAGQLRLPGEDQPEWVEIDIKRIRVENPRQFGSPWLALYLWKILEFPEVLKSLLPMGREDIPWSDMVSVLALSRLCNPSSELALAEQEFEHSALGELLGIPPCKVNDDRLYRTLDHLIKHKSALETHLKNRAGELFYLKYDLLLYDITSTYFEGMCKNNPQAKRGYSRDNRSDCLQVCIALVVSREGMPLGYEVLDGNRHDVNSVEDIVKLMESRYGEADRVWVMDRGMASEDNFEFLKEENRRYIIGAPRCHLKKFEAELLSSDWTSIREGLEVKSVPSPEGKETFILCRSVQRQAKEKAMHDRCIEKIETGLLKLVSSCEKKKQKIGVIERRIGKLLGSYSHEAGLFEINTSLTTDGKVSVEWKKEMKWQEWADLSEGCYLLRTNITDWSPDDLWHAYIQLTQAEAAFRIQKSDLKLRPIWHQKEERVKAHILVCFLAYVLWKTLGLLCKRAGLGDEPRKVLDEISKIQVVDVVVPTRSGVEIRRRCITQPTPYQAILLQQLKLQMPSYLKITKM